MCTSFHTFLMSSSVWISGDSPPCTHKNCWFIRAARGRQSNASMQESYTCSEYLILPGGGWRNGEIFQDLRQRSAQVCFNMSSHHRTHKYIHTYSQSLSLEVNISKAENKQEAFTWMDLKNSVIKRLQTDLYDSFKNIYTLVLRH